MCINRVKARIKSCLRYSLEARWPSLKCTVHHDTRHNNKPIAMVAGHDSNYCRNK